MRIAMDRKYMFWSVLCVSLAAIHASYLTPPADIEGELGSIASRLSLTQGELKPDYEQQQYHNNDDPDLIDQTTYPTESTSVSFVQASKTTENPRDFQYDQTTLEANEETTENEEETQLPTQNIPTIQNMIESSTNNAESLDDTTISSQALDQTTSRSVEINEATQPTNENSTVTGSSPPSVNDTDTSEEEEEEEEEDEDETSAPITAPSDVSPAPNGPPTTSADPDIFQNNTSFLTETDISVTDATDATNEVIPHNNDSTTEGLEIAAIETTPQNILVTTTSNMFTSSESFAATIYPNNKTSLNTSAELKTHCDSDKTCSDDEVCVSHVGGCICESSLNAYFNQPLCQNQYEVTPSSNSPTVDQNFENNTNKSNQATQRDFEHVFFTKKWKELSGKEKSRNTVTLSFSPAPEVAEWFQTCDWKFRKYIALALTACMENNVGNDSDNRPIISSSDIVYLAPTPRRNDEAIIVSILVLDTWSGVNNSFLDNKAIIGCLGEGLEQCEAELELTVNKIDGVFPTRLLGDSTITVAGLTPSTIKLLFIGTVVSLILIVISLVLLIVKCRQVSSRHYSRSGLYRHPRVLLRSPGDGHNLATDEQCQQDEGRRCDPENGNVVGKVDSDTWVVPLEEVQPPKRGSKTGKNDDTKV